MLVPRQGRRERPYQADTGATEDAGSGRAARPGRHKVVSLGPLRRVWRFRAAGLSGPSRGVIVSAVPTSAQRKLARGIEHVETLRSEAATFEDDEAYVFPVERERRSP